MKRLFISTKIQNGFNIILLAFGISISAFPNDALRWTNLAKGYFYLVSFSSELWILGIKLTFFSQTIVYSTAFIYQKCLEACFTQNSS